MPPYLGAVLFDVDGTLIQGGNQLHRDAFAYGVGTVFDFHLDVHQLQPAGRTDLWLLTEGLKRAGVNPKPGQIQACFALMEDYFLTHDEDLSEQVLPGVRPLLAALKQGGFLLGLLTGNLPAIAKAKMERTDLIKYFSVGSYGADSVSRRDVVTQAIKVVKPITQAVPLKKIVVVGDTPYDVEAAQSEGLLAIAVATGGFTLTQLRASAADLVLPDLTYRTEFQSFIAGTK